MTTKKRGFVIAIDGPDGVGKTTQVQLLGAYLTSLGKKVHSTRHSGGTPIGQELRKVSLSNHERPVETDFYISLAMHASLAQDVSRRKESGEIVIIDRSPFAMLAYNGYGSQMPDRKFLFKTCEKMFKELGIDFLIHLGAPTEVIEGRRETRGAIDYFESKNSAYHQRVRQGYADGLEFLTNHPELGAKVINLDASSDIDSVHRAIVKTIQAL